MKSPKQTNLPDVQLSFVASSTQHIFAKVRVAQTCSKVVILVIWMLQNAFAASSISAFENLGISLLKYRLFILEINQYSFPPCPKKAKVEWPLE